MKIELAPTAPGKEYGAMHSAAKHGQYCPVAKATEILGDHWTPLIIRELLAGARRFSHIDRGLPGISRPILAQRLRWLQELDVVARRTAPDGHPEYSLTPAGQELKAVIDALGNWGAHWILKDPTPEELDPAFLLWQMRRRMDTALLPPRRTVVQFEFRGACRQRAWLVIDPDEVSVCLTDPGFDVDLMVRADTGAFFKAWVGRIDLREAMREGSIEFDGPPGLVRAFTRSLLLSRFAGAVQAAIRQPTPRALHR